MGVDLIIIIFMFLFLLFFIDFLEFEKPINQFLIAPIAIHIRLLKYISKSELALG